MNIFEGYKSLYETHLKRESFTPYKSEKKVSVLPPLEVKVITLAEEDATTKDLLIAHRVKDYRKRLSLLTLLPETNSLFKKLIGGRHIHE